MFMTLDYFVTAVSSDQCLQRVNKMDRHKEGDKTILKEARKCHE
jgi:hypothetical protein